MRKILMATIVIIISTLFAWFMGEYALGIYESNIASSSDMDQGLIRYHPTRGWQLSPNWSGNHTHHDFNVNYSTDSIGFRKDTKNLLTNKKAIIALVGDSFTFGLGANDDATFSAQLNQKETNYFFLNAGIPGYSTDQQLLFIRDELKQLPIKHFILCFYLGNDLLDNLLPYPLQAEQGKPVFQLNGDKLELTNTPVPKKPKPPELSSTNIQNIVFGEELPKASKLKQWANSSNILRRIYPAKLTADKIVATNILQRRLAEHEKLLKRLLVEIKTEIERDNKTLAIAIIPGQSFILSPDSYSALLQQHAQKIITQHSKDYNIKIIDVAKKLRSEYKKGDDWFHPNEGHFNNLGNRKVADIFEEGLNEIIK